MVVTSDGNYDTIADGGIWEEGGDSVSTRKLLVPVMVTTGRHAGVTITGNVPIYIDFLLLPREGYYNL